MNETPSTAPPPVTLKIAGQTVAFAARYRAGHVLDAAEAAALSAALVRRGARSYRRYIEAAINGETSMAAAQAAIARNYELADFGDSHGDTLARTAAARRLCRADGVAEEDMDREIALLQRHMPNRVHLEMERFRAVSRKQTIELADLVINEP